MRECASHRELAMVATRRSKRRRVSSWAHVSRCATHRQELGSIEGTALTAGLVRVDPTAAYTLRVRMEKLADESHTVLLSREAILRVAQRAADPDADAEAIRDGVLAFLLCAGQSPGQVCEMNLYGFAVPGIVPIVASVSQLLSRWTEYRGMDQGPYMRPIGKRSGRVLSRRMNTREVLRIVQRWHRMELGAG